MPSVVVDDFFAMTRHSYVSAKAALEGFATGRALSMRATGCGAPLHVVFGADDQ
jgi:hypothetical protein